jgi:hypothetical protein
VRGLLASGLFEWMLCAGIGTRVGLRLSGRASYSAGSGPSNSAAGSLTVLSRRSVGSSSRAAVTIMRSPRETAALQRLPGGLSIRAVGADPCGRAVSGVADSRCGAEDRDVAKDQVPEPKIAASEELVPSLDRGRADCVAIGGGRFCPGDTAAGSVMTPCSCVVVHPGIEPPTRPPVG